MFYDFLHMSRIQRSLKVSLAWPSLPFSLVDECGTVGKEKPVDIFMAFIGKVWKKAINVALYTAMFS